MDNKYVPLLHDQEQIDGFVIQVLYQYYDIFIQ